MYKKANLDDFDMILAFCQELNEQDAKMSFVSLASKYKLQEQLEDEIYHFYIAVLNDQVVAMFRAKRGTGNKSHACYVACAVKKEYRKQNLATDITNYGLADLKTLGVLIARTYIYSWNKASIATIKKCSFEEGGRVLMHQYEPDLGEYIDDLLFHRVL
jgi:RimJ/RimL family protein N-acetyltransferase